MPNYFSSEKLLNYFSLEGVILSGQSAPAVKDMNRTVQKKVATKRSGKEAMKQRSTYPFGERMWSCKKHGGRHCSELSKLWIPPLELPSYSPPPQFPRARGTSTKLFSIKKLVQETGGYKLFVFFEFLST